MRCTAKPQLRAMSLALEAQGDTVPKRGDTQHTGTSELANGLGAAWASSNCAIRAVSLAPKALGVATQKTSFAINALSEGTASCKVCSKRWILKGLKASPP